MKNGRECIDATDLNNAEKPISNGAKKLASPSSVLEPDLLHSGPAGLLMENRRPLVNKLGGVNHIRKSLFRFLFWSGLALSWRRRFLNELFNKFQGGSCEIFDHRVFGICCRFFEDLFPFDDISRI